MTATIALFLLQDGVINGAIYAILGVSLVILFSVTRVIFVPQGEFVAWGALTLAAFESGRAPGTIYLLVALGAAAALLDCVRARATLTGADVLRRLALDVAAPCALAAVALWLAPRQPPLWAAVLLTIALIAPMGPLVYRIAFAPLAGAGVLTLFIAAIGMHFAMTGLGLAFFGAEGFRTTPFIEGVYRLGPLPFKGQSIAVLALTIVLLAALSLFFGRTLTGKALRATAVNRLGARLVAIPVRRTGFIAFALAAAIGALCGAMIGSLTTISFDTGFIVGLKGFIAAIAAGLVSYPVTVVAAIALGVAESFAAFEASAFKEAIVFLLILPLLAWRSLSSGGHDEEEEEA